MEEAAIHPAAVQQPHGARIAIRQDRFGPVLRRDRFQPLRDGVQRFVPGDAFEAAFALRADAPLRIEQAVGMVLPIPLRGMPHDSSLL